MFLLTEDILWSFKS